MSNHAENTGSLLITSVKQCRAQTVLRRATAQDYGGSCKRPSKIRNIYMALNNQQGVLISLKNQSIAEEKLTNRKSYWDLISN